MKRIAVISGKGGTGKTMVCAALAAIFPPDLVLGDCDVDASNLGLIFQPEIISRSPYYGLKVAEIDQDTCTRCGSCEEHCRFGAIRSQEGEFLVDSIRCEGCSVCTLVCPKEAVSMVQKVNGELYYSNTRIAPLSHARLEPGSGTSGLLVREVRKQADERDGDRAFFLSDGPPGIGCPLIATVTGMDAVLIVTEPSLSGLHDLKRVVTVAEGFGVTIFVAINKYTLEEEIATRIEDYCVERGLHVVGKIPFDPTVIESIRNGRPVTDYDSPAADAIRRMWEEIAEIWVNT